jgi:hypothetical protein
MMPFFRIGRLVWVPGTFRVAFGRVERGFVFARVVGVRVLVNLLDDIGVFVVMSAVCQERAHELCGSFRCFSDLVCHAVCILTRSVGTRLNWAFWCRLYA